MTAVSNQFRVFTGTIPDIYGLTVTGPGIPPNTYVVNYSTTAATITLSNAATATGASVPLNFSSGNVTLATEHANGFGTSGSIDLSC